MTNHISPRTLAAAAGDRRPAHIIPALGALYLAIFCLCISAHTDSPPTETLELNRGADALDGASSLSGKATPRSARISLDDSAADSARLAGSVCGNPRIAANWENAAIRPLLARGMQGPRG